MACCGSVEACNLPSVERNFDVAWMLQAEKLPRTRKNPDRYRNNKLYLTA